MLPLTQPGPMRKDAKGRRTRTPPLRLAFNLNHTYLLSSTAVIRAGLPEVDLLAGGAVGIGGFGVTSSAATTAPAAEGTH